MNHQTQRQLDLSPTPTHQVLLLGDDGRMAQLIQTRLPELKVQPIYKITDGILELTRNNYTAVLLNAQKLEKKTEDAVKGLRKINPNLKIFTYGDPFTEIYSRKAISSGADDYLVWPIPPSELRNMLKPKKTIAPVATNGSDPSRLTPQQEKGANAPLEKYRELSQWAGQDKTILISQAENILAETLSLTWVKIHEDQTKLPESSQSLPLNGPFGQIGQLHLGPPLNPQQPASQELINESALFIATLIHLAQRCEGLKHLATIDELTGAHNRRYLEFYLQKIIDQNKEGHTNLSLLLFDIDNFKHYNDTYGHAAGDEILKQITQLIRRCCREQDVVARIGGDEFAVLFWDVGAQREKYSNSDREETTTDHAGTPIFLSNRFRRMLMASEFPALGPEARGVLTISGGLANFAQDTPTTKTLLAKADQALLAAKRSGKNRIHLVGPEE
jgi:diguanylate cyclase (GGDEF)-like protein